jgi:methanogenic corrinoid protein MtbC1
MTPQSRQHAAMLEQVQRGMAELALDALWERDPTMEQRYGAAGRRIWRAELASRLAHLVEAVAADRPELFEGNAGWARAALVAREVPDADVRAHLAALAKVIRDELPPAPGAAAAAIVERAIDAPAHIDAMSSILDDHASDATLARLYLLHLLQRERDQAARLVLEARRGGMPPAQVCARIILPALAEIGRMWHMHEASIADEHACTAATAAILAQLRLDAPRAPSNGRRALCCAVGGDMHEIGIRVVADLLELDGWDVEYLGANTPAGEVVGSLEPDPVSGARPFDLLVLGASTTLSLRATADTIEAVRAMPGPRIPVMVGGAPFRAVPDLWQSVGADACARCIEDAVASANALAGDPARVR